MMVIILSGFNNVDVITKANSASVVNETVLTVNQAGDSLSRATSPACQATIIQVFNATSHTVIGSGNFTVTDCILFASNTVSGGFNNTQWNVTYDVTFGDTAFVSGNRTLVGIGSFGDFWTIIVLAVVAAVVLGIIFGLFGGMRGKR